MNASSDFLARCEFSELSGFSPAEFDQFCHLMSALSQRCVLTPDMLQSVIDCPDSHLYVVRHGDAIVACATLCLFASPTGRKASIEDVVVLPEFQGLGLGRALMDYLLERAASFAPITLQLTSRPSRIAANALYQKLGFLPKETNFYTMKIEEQKI